MIKFSDLSSLPGVKKAVIYRDYPVEYIFTDSRKPITHTSALFIAIAGEIHDGHGYIPELYDMGIRLFVVAMDPIHFHKKSPEANFIQVGNPISFLQEIVLHKRSFFKARMIGITGSNGKTIVKEWLSKMLSGRHSVLKSPASYNSQIGVPLSIWPINTYHDIGVLEAGISRKNEMENLERLINPDIGIFTNIGPAHDEGFISREEKIIEKLKLFRHSKTIICCSNHVGIYNLIKEQLPDIHVISWGDSNDDYIKILKINKHEHYTLIEVRVGDSSNVFNIPFVNTASVENTMHCITVLSYLDWSNEDIQKEIQALDEIPMRLELKKGINNCSIIDDTYNNDLAGLDVALSFLANQKHKRKKSLILSDILQTGTSDEELYSNLGKLLNRNQLHKVYVIGSSIAALSDYYSASIQHFPSTNDFLKNLNTEDFKDEIILVKGARPFRFEKIVKELQEKVHGTVLEINLDQVSNNLNVFRKMLPVNTQIMVMVKALAYGSGSLEIANLMQYHKVDYLGVAYIDEGIYLRTNGISTPIMVMNPSKESFDKLIRFRLEPEVYSFQILYELGLYLRKNRQFAKIHIKLDTGMHRLGFVMEDLDAIIEKLIDFPELKVASIFSHFAGADDPSHDAFTHKQATLFKMASDKISNALSITPMRHICNSAGMIRFPEYQWDMVRLGIGLYGFDIGLKELHALRPISTLKSEISQIKYLKPGESAGYNRVGLAKRKTKIATIAIGYADGFSRAFSNGKVKIFVNGKMAPVFGNVCMDMTMIDVTGIDVQEGDPVIIFGPEASIFRLAEAIDTIPYEILTGVSDRVKRVFYSS